MKNFKETVYVFFTGLLMGSADVVPGVSGGTVALVMGIYKELIHSIKKVSGLVLKLLLQLKFKQAFQETPFVFLIPLGLGILTAILLLANLITYLLQEYPVYLWALFFGFVLASAVIVQKRITKWEHKTLAAAVISAVSAFFIVGAVPVNTPESLLFLFISGTIAICATILPGVSGSFLLVIMGKYEQILTAIVERDFVTLGVFFAGAALGLALFARLLSYLFVRYHDVVMATLTGLMIGSLRKIWPWQEVVTTRINSEGELVPLVTRNIIPSTFDGPFFIAITLFIIAMLLVLYLDRLQGVKKDNALT